MLHNHPRQMATMDAVCTADVFPSLVTIASDVHLLILWNAVALAVHTGDINKQNNGIKKINFPIRLWTTPDSGHFNCTRYSVCTAQHLSSRFSYTRPRRLLSSWMHPSLLLGYFLWGTCRYDFMLLILYFSIAAIYIHCLLATSH